MAKKSLTEMYAGPLMASNGGYPYFQPQVPQIQVPGIPGNPMLPNQMTKEEADQYLKNKGSYREFSEQKELLPLKLEEEARKRLMGSPEYAQIRAAMDAQIGARGDYLNYLEQTEPTDKYLRAAGTAGRGLASFFGDPSLGKIVEAPLTPEQKYTDAQKILADQFATSGTDLSLLNDFIKNKLTGKTTITDTTGFEAGASAGAARTQDNKPKTGDGPRKLTDKDKVQQEKIAEHDARVQAMRDLVADFESIKSRYPEGKIPGSGIIGSATPGVIDSMIGSQASLDALAVKSILKQIASLKVFDLSGKAATDREFERTQAYVTGGKFSSYKEFNRAVNAVIVAYDRAQRRYYAGYQPENVAAVRGRADQSLPKGPPTDGSVPKKEAPKESAVQRRRREEAQKQGIK